MYILVNQSMSVDHIIEGFVIRELEKWSWEDDNIYCIRLQTLIHGESTCNG